MIFSLLFLSSYISSVRLTLCVCVLLHVCVCVLHVCVCVCEWVCVCVYTAHSGGLSRVCVLCVSCVCVQHSLVDTHGENAHDISPGPLLLSPHRSHLHPTVSLSPPSLPAPFSPCASKSFVCVCGGGVMAPPRTNSPSVCPPSFLAHSRARGGGCWTGLFSMVYHASLKKIFSSLDAGTFSILYSP